VVGVEGDGCDFVRGWFCEVQGCLFGFDCDFLLGGVV